MVNSCIQTVIDIYISIGKDMLHYLLFYYYVAMSNIYVAI